MARSLSGTLIRGGRGNTGCLIAFGAVFFLFGSFFVVMFSVRPFVQSQIARGWTERPCRILSSEVSESRDSDSTTYGVAIRYEYTFDDRRFEGDRYDFARISDGDRGEKALIVARYPVGSEATCWVDPKDPSRSVLTREYTFRPFLTLFMLIFPTVGLVVMVAGWRSRRGTADAPIPKTVVAPRMRPDRSRGLVVLTSDEKAGTIALVVLSLFWNGIVWTIAYFVYRRSGGADLCVQLFVGLFALIGLVVLYAAIRKILEGMKPRPGLRLNADKLMPGGSAELQWGFSSGDTGGTSRLCLTLIGRESATYRRGTKTTTDKSVFARLVLVDTSSAKQIQRGNVSVPIPADTMHSWIASNNRIEWVIELVQEIPNWPDVKCEYAVTMHLPGANGGSHA